MSDFYLTDAVQGGGGGFWQIDIECADGDFTAAEIYGDDLEQVARRAEAMLAGLTHVMSPSTCGTKAAGRNEPNPPPEGKVASQPVAWQARPIGGQEWSWSALDRLPDALNDTYEYRPLYASPTEQASDVSGLVEALRPFAEAAGDLEPSDPNGMNLWEHPIAITLEAGHLRAALSALSQAQQVKP